MGALPLFLDKLEALEEWPINQTLWVAELKFYTFDSFQIWGRPFLLLNKGYFCIWGPYPYFLQKLGPI